MGCGLIKGWTVIAVVSMQYKANTVSVLFSLDLKLPDILRCLGISHNNDNVSHTFKLGSNCKSFR